MNRNCPNCGQTARGLECPWCHYPLVDDRTVVADFGAKRNPFWKLLNRTISVVLGLVIAGFAFIYISPGYDAYLVRSESMVPAINMGDIIITGSVNGTINGAFKPGTIITFLRGKELVTHRVQSIKGDQISTKGDNVEEPDPWQVSLGSIKGVYLFKLPYLGYLPSILHTRLGWFLLVILPSTILLISLVKEIIKEALKPETQET